MVGFYADRKVTVLEYYKNEYLENENIKIIAGEMGIIKVKEGDIITNNNLCCVYENSHR